MTRKELCAWLRANSSGIYRPAADAAAEIERLEEALKYAHGGFSLAYDKLDNWHHEIDPYECINVGDMIDNGETRVIGFCSPSGIEPNRLMVNIEYKDGGKTTRYYASVLVQKIKGKVKKA